MDSPGGQGSERRVMTSRFLLQVEDGLCGSPCCLGHTCLGGGAVGGASTPAGCLGRPRLKEPPAKQQ